MIILSLFSLILLGLVLIMGLGEQQPLHVLSIVDHTSWLAALVKDYSILRSALSPATLHFNYLVIESENFTASHFDRNLLQSLNVNRTIVVWKKPKALNVLRNERFEIDAIFARFYLPGLFPSLKRFLYLDNDVVVNVDVAEIITRPLYRYSEVPSVPHQPPVTQAVSTDGPRSQLSHSNAKAIRRKQGNAAVGMVYEMHPYYRSYMSTHFNTSHHLYRQVAAVLDKDAFLNAGVFVVDCDLWKVRNYTSIAEALILQNHQEHFYSTSVGDQGTFYLMLGDEVSFLPAQYNMRRFPKKTFHMLEQGFQGKATL